MIQCLACPHWNQSRHHTKNSTFFGYCLNLNSEKYDDLIEEYYECSEEIDK